MVRRLQGINREDGLQFSRWWIRFWSGCYVSLRWFFLCARWTQRRPVASVCLCNPVADHAAVVFVWSRGLMWRKMG